MGEDLPLERGLGFEGREKVDEPVPLCEVTVEHPSRDVAFPWYLGFLEDEHLDPLPGERQPGRRASRPRSDNDYVEFGPSSAQALSGRASRVSINFGTNS